MSLKSRLLKSTGTHIRVVTDSIKMSRAQSWQPVVNALLQQRSFLAASSQQRYKLDSVFQSFRMASSGASDPPDSGGERPAEASKAAAAHSDPQASGRANDTPPADWYKRGTWVDPASIARRMTTEEPEHVLAREPDTPVGRSLSAMIKARILSNLLRIAQQRSPLCLPADKPTADFRSSSASP